MHSFSKGTHINKATGSCYDVNSTIREFWEIEIYGTEPKQSVVMTKEEKVEESLKHNGSRYSLAVPWKENCPTLPKNVDVAMKRLESTERSLQTKDSLVKKEYREAIKSYDEKGYRRKLSQDETYRSHYRLGTYHFSL